MIEIAGHFSRNIIDTLNLNISEGTEIFISESTLEHILKNHPEIEDNRKFIIAQIIKNPTYVSFRKKDGSIGFYKEFETGEHYYLDLSVRASSIGEYFVRTLHIIKTKRLKWYLEKEKIKPLDNFSCL